MFFFLFSCLIHLIRSNTRLIFLFIRSRKLFNMLFTLVNCFWYDWHLRKSGRLEYFTFATRMTNGCRPRHCFYIEKIPKICRKLIMNYSLIIICWWQFLKLNASWAVYLILQGRGFVWMIVYNQTTTNLHAEI